MKKLFLLFIICCFYDADTHAQCTPVDCPGAPSLFDFGGICTSDIPTGLVGTPYVESASFRVTNVCFNPADFDTTLPDLVIRLRNLRNFVFSGLPTGLTALTNASTYTTGANPVVGCVGVNGTPSTAGVFAASIDVTAGIRSWLIGGCNGLIPLDVDQAFGFSLDLIILPDPSFTGLAPSYTTLDAPVTLVPTGTMGGSFSGPGVSGSVFSPLMAGPGTHEIIYSVTVQQGLAVAPASNADTMIVLVTPGGCQPGFYFNPETSECEPCPGGTFEFEGSCSPCASGEYSDPGETSCGPCPQGFIVNETQTGCLLCPADTTYIYNATCDLEAVGETDTTYLTNQASCDSLVITEKVQDTIAPIALCQDITLHLDANGEAIVPPALVDNGSSDECLVGLSVSPSLMRCANVGQNTVTLGAVDPSFNYGSCNATVTVIDTVAPVLNCTPVLAYTDGGVCEAFVTVPPPDVVDNCDNQDTIPLITGLSTPGVIITDTIIGAFDQMMITAPYGSTVTSLTVDVDVSHTWVSDIDIGMFSPNGNLVTLMSRPVNCSDDNLLITFADTASVTAAQLDTWCQGTDPWFTGSAQSPTLLSTLAGDSVNGFWVFYVQDFSENDNGVINAWRVNIRYNDPNGRAGVVRYERDLRHLQPAGLELWRSASNSAEEKRAAQQTGLAGRQAVTLINDYTGTSDASAVYPIGTTIIQWTATDENGNADSCFQEITVADTTSPAAICQDITVALDGTGNVSIVAADVDDGSNDACEPVTIDAAPLTFTCSEIGPNSVTLTVTDTFSNVGNCVATVTVSDPLVACCPDEQLLFLNSGWNMVSSYIDPQTPDMLDLLSDIEDAVIILKDGEGKVVIPSLPLNQVGDWVVTEGYQLKTNRDTTLVIGCTQVAPELTPVNLPAGWSIAPYLRDDNLDAAAAFASLGDTLIIAKDNAGNVYIPSFPLNNIGDLIPGNGYQVKLTEPATLLYQANTIRQQGADTYTQPTPPQRLVYAGNTGNNATILLPKGSVEGIADGDEIGLFNAHGDLVGSTVYRDGPMAITVWGNDQVTDDARHLTVGEPFRFKVSRTDGTLQDLWPSYQSGPTSYTVNGLTVVATARLQPRDVLTGSLELYAYPNPANTTLYFDIVAVESAEVKLTLYDLTGKVVMAPVFTRLEAGHNLIDLDVSGLAAGEYFYTARSADGLANGKVIVVR